MQAPESYNLTQVMDLINPAPATHRTRPSEANGTWYRRSPSPASLRSAPSPALRERGHKAHITKPLSRTAGEGGPSPKGWVGEGCQRSILFGCSLLDANSCRWAPAERNRKSSQQGKGE